jgi:signal transduction histidine kinase
MASQKEREEFIAMFVSEAFDKLGQTKGTCERAIELARLIMRDAATHGRLAVEDCNRGLTESERKREGECEKRIAERAAFIGARCKFGGDPRGHTVKLLLRSNRGNTWGGASEGWGVPQ